MFPSLITATILGRMRLTKISMLLICFLAATASGQSPGGQLKPLRPVWKYAMPGAMGISANVHLAVAADSKGNVVALETQSGKELWKAKAPTGASSPASIADDLLLIGTNTGQVVAFSISDGMVKWTAKAGSQVVGAPLIEGQSAIFGSYDNRIYCVDLATGKERWQFETAAQVHAAVVGADGLFMVAGCDGRLRALDAATGKEKWSAELSGPVATSPIVHDGQIYVTTMDASVYQVDMAGAVTWKQAFPEAAKVTQQPAIVAGRLMVLDDDGGLFALDLRTGKTLASAKLGASPSALCPSGDQLLVGTSEGRVLLVDNEGRIVSRVTLGGAIDRIVVVGSKVLASTDKGIVWMLEP